MIDDLLNNIKQPDEAAKKAARERQASLAKPPGSLGKLEEISVKMAGVTGKVKNTIDKSCVAVFCADNGVAEENIASAPQTVTMAQAVNLTKRVTGAGALAESFGSELLIVDMGMKYKAPAELYDTVPLKDTRKIVDRRVRAGTYDITEGPAMSRDEALQCISAGAEMADALSDGGFDIIGAGEMGIGNTTTSAAVLSAVTGMDSDSTCGRGGGITEESFQRKKHIVDEASRGYRSRGGLLKDAGSKDIIDVLAEMGGFDMCAMTGLFLGGAAERMPVVIDGYISAVSALAAYILAPLSAGYMFASHASSEKGYETAIKAIGLEPFLDLNMRLGEGSGCPLAFNVIKGACDAMNNMATFDEAGINDDYLDDIRKGDCF